MKERGKGCRGNPALQLQLCSSASTAQEREGCLRDACLEDRRLLAEQIPSCVSVIRVQLASLSPDLHRASRDDMTSGMMRELRVKASFASPLSSDGE